MKTNEIISLGASCTALACSLIALFHVLPRELGLDYLGVIVGILAFLITLLLGWNIYTVVDFKRKIEELDKKNKEIKAVLNLANKIQNEREALIYNQLSILTGFNLKVYPEKSLPYTFLNQLSLVASWYSAAKDKDNVEDTIDRMVCFLKSYAQKDLTAEERHDIYTLLESNLQEKMNLKQYLELVKLLLR